MTAPVWGMVDRGRVWHVLTAETAAAWPRIVGGQASTWCGSDEPVALLAEVRPPQGARPCRRCCTAVDELSRVVSLVQADSAAVEARRTLTEPLLVDVPESYRGRPVEDVDLIGALNSLPTGEEG